MEFGEAPFTVYPDFSFSPQSLETWGRNAGVDPNHLEWREAFSLPLSPLLPTVWIHLTHAYSVNLDI